MTAATFDLRGHRASRVAAGLCIQCGEPNDGETQACAYHRELARQRRARYDATQRSRDMSGKQPLAHVRIMQRHLQELRNEQLHELAAELGRVPTVREVGELFSYSSPAYSKCAQRDRNSAFGIRKATKREVRTVIPYPVPAEWQVTT